MNYSIIKQEFANLSDIFDVSGVQKSQSFGIIPKNFFDVQDTRVHLTDTQVSNKHDHSHEPHSSYNHIKDTSSVTDTGVFKRSNRQNIILGLLKKKKELTIKDIAMVIKDCSEKTIQRELISFIDAGVLKRTGERRWSKYSLA